MAVATHPTARIALHQAQCATVNGGSFVVKSGSTVLGSMALSATAFGTPTNPSGSTVTAVANSISNSGAPAQTGVNIDNGELRNSAGVAMITFTIGTSGADMIIGNVSVPANTSYFSCSSLTWNHIVP